MELSSQRKRRRNDSEFQQAHGGGPLYAEKRRTQESGGRLQENRRILSDISFEKQRLGNKIDNGEANSSEMDRFIVVYQEVLARQQIIDDVERLRGLISNEGDPSIDLQIETLKSKIRSAMEELESSE